MSNNSVIVYSQDPQSESEASHTPSYSSSPSVVPYVSGKITVQDARRPTFHERVRIAVCLKASPTLRTKETWEALLKKKEPVAVTNPKRFRIDESYWFDSGATWVIPTQIFETTQIELALEPSALLANGFTIEVYLRYTTLVKQYTAQTSLATGGKVKFAINWKLYPELDQADPKFERANWKNEDRPKPEESTSKASRKSNARRLHLPLNCHFESPR